MIREILLGLGALALAESADGQITVSASRNATALADGEVAPIAHSSTDRQVATQQIGNSASATASGATLGKPTGINMAIGTSLPLSTLQFKNTGRTAISGALATRLQAGYLYATDYMTAAQIADGMSRTDKTDVSAALNACLTDAVEKGKTCFLPGGKWKVSGAQLIINYGANLNGGGSLVGESVSATSIDLTANSANPPFLVTARGGTATRPISTTYGTVSNIAFIASVAGPVMQIGQTDLSDQINQMRFEALTIQNLSTNFASSCATWNSVYSASVDSVNCATAVGPNGGNYLWTFNNVSFSVFNSMGGSNGGTELHITGGTSTGNQFNAWDCEVVTTCLKIDSLNATNNIWLSGTWSYNWGSSRGYGVVETAGGNNAAFHPNQNFSRNGGNTTFLSSGSGTYFALFDNTIATQGGANSFTGENSYYGNQIFNVAPVFAAGIRGSGAVAFSTGPAAGSGASVGCTSGRVCDGLSGTATLTTGSSPTIGSLVKVTLPFSRAHAPNCVANIKGISSGNYSDSESPLTITFNVTLALLPGSQYYLGYVCGGG